MKRKQAIQEPHVYITPGLKEGEEAVIYIITPKQRFFNLIFKETQEETVIPYINTDRELHLDSKPVLKEEIRKIEDRIVALGELYTCYNYLLTIKDNTIYLLNITLPGISLGDDITKTIAKEINIPVLTPTWKGKYTTHTTFPFVEDIFVQKK